MDLWNWTVKWPLQVDTYLNFEFEQIVCQSYPLYVRINIFDYNYKIHLPNLGNFLKSILFINSRTKSDSAHGDLISVRPTTTASNGRDVITEALTYIKENLLVLAFSSSPPAPPPRVSNIFFLWKVSRLIQNVIKNHI